MSRTPLIHGLLAGMACGIALSATVPSAADPAQIGRLDLHASCPQLVEQLEAALDPIWASQRLFENEVRVQLAIQNGRVGAVQTARQVRPAEAARCARSSKACPAVRRRLRANRSSSFNASFIDPERTSRAEATAKTAASE